MIRKIFSNRLLLIGLGIVVALGFIIPSVYSGGPQFNYMPDDLEILVARNYSEDGEWMDPAEAQIGDTVSFQFYYHNGVENTTAFNTRVRADLPKTASDKLVVDGYLWANNADIVADTATVNIGEVATLEYLPGTTKWFPNRSQEGQPLPDGIVSDDGVSIGDIEGCWPYAGFVTFRARLVSPPEAQLVKSKSAYNITQSANAESVVAKPNDKIRYSLKVENTGNADGSIAISDDISKVLQYANMVNLGGGTLSGSTISWPEITVEAGESVTKNFVVKIKEAIPANETVYLINSYGNRVEVPARRDVTINPQLTLVKKVRNISRGENQFVEQNTADPGDTLEYLIVARNPGDVRLENHLILDALPNKLNFIKGSVKYGYNNEPIDNPAGDTLITGGGEHFNNFFVGSKLNVTFKAKVDSNLTPGNYRLINKASNEADFNTEIENGRLTNSDTAVTLVSVQAQPTFEIDKKVKNITYPTNYMDRVTAIAGDRVGYKITLTNTSNVDIDHLEVVDILPANTSLVPSSVRILIGDNWQKIDNNLTEEYVQLPRLKANDNLIISLKADTDKALSEGSELINTAKARYNLTKSDSAFVVIKEPKVQAVEIEGPMPATGNSIYFLIAGLGLAGLTYINYKYQLI
jgi:uncharacterized repeat protein (TIGR01451 family)